MRLFGAISREANDPLNVCILISRFFIWYCRCSKAEPNFQALLMYIRFYVRAMKVTFFIKGKPEQYYDTWSNFIDWIDADE